MILDGVRPVFQEWYGSLEENVFEKRRVLGVLVMFYGEVPKRQNGRLTSRKPMFFIFGFETTREEG